VTRLRVDNIAPQMKRDEKKEREKNGRKKKPSRR
jgi:hypothetical protein